MAEGQRSSDVRFRDRSDAGRRLAEDLGDYAGRDRLIVLALPRGGVPVAWEVAVELRAPLDVFLVRKLGVPGHEELAMGAIASGGVRFIDQEVTSAMGVTEDSVARVASEEQHELARREREYRGSRAEPVVRDRTAILVDDGLATGSTMSAAVLALRALEPREIVVAAPVGAREACDEFRKTVDAVVCSATPDPFRAVGVWYEDFSQVSDDEVKEILRRAEDELPTSI